MDVYAVILYDATEDAVLYVGGRGTAEHEAATWKTFCQQIPGEGTIVVDVGCNVERGYPVVDGKSVRSCRETQLRVFQ